MSAARGMTGWRVAPPACFYLHLVLKATLQYGHSPGGDVLPIQRCHQTALALQRRRKVGTLAAFSVPVPSSAGEYWRLDMTTRSSSCTWCELPAVMKRAAARRRKRSHQYSPAREPKLWPPMYVDGHDRGLEQRHAIHVPCVAMCIDCKKGSGTSLDGAAPTLPPCT